MRMARITLGRILVGLLITTSVTVAQAPQPLRISYAEPPQAEPGEFKPAPPETTVTPGEPRALPPLDVRSADQPSGVEPAQYVTPGVRPATAPKTPEVKPTVLYPEPPTPTVKISVKGMDTAATGQDLTYRLTVVNTSEARAHNVVVRCPVPRGTKLVKALPEAKGDDRNLEWQLGTLEPSANRIIDVVFKPGPETTDISVVGKVQFEHGRVVRTKIVNPMLEMKKTGPAEGILQEPMTYRIILTNPGIVPVTDVQIVDTLPEGLEYVQETAHGATPVSKVGPKPNQRTWIIATIKPKETQTINYRVMGRKLGDWTSEAQATGMGVHEKAGCNTTVHEARITLQVDGPTDGKAAANQSTPYLIHVHNTGTAVLHNVRITCSYPHELRLAKVSSGGHFYKDGAQWMIPSLGPNETKDVSMALTAPSPGLRDIVVSARGDKGLEQRKKLSTAFEGIPALNWQAEGTPVAVPDQEIVYTIRITNPGSAPAKNVKIVADLPEQVEFRKAQPDFQRGQGAVFFTPQDIPPKQTVTLKIIVVAKKPGEARFQFEMTAEGMSSGPLKQSRATTISPSGKAKDIDPTRIGTLSPLDAKKSEPTIVVPAGGISPAEPSSPPAPGTDR
jgi:uncharacterized repeat protein (TIGR01451 family)